MPPPQDSSSHKPVLALSAEPKARGANRSTKVAGKLKVLPDQPTPPQVSSPGIPSAGAGPTTGNDILTSPRVPSPPPRRTDTAVSGQGTTEDSDDDDVDDEEGEAPGEEVYNQIALIPEGTARRDALRLTKARAKSLPRVTAYATANSYRFHELMKFFKARREAYHTDPRQIDEVLYTPYAYEPEAESTQPSTANGKKPAADATGDLLGVPELVGNPDSDYTQEQQSPPKKRKKSKFDATPTQAEIFIFKYGTVVIWGMTEAQEKRFLSSIKRFEVERLDTDDIEMEDLNYYYANYSRIYNDVITLRKGSGYMTKLSLSHALSQSVKISLFEEVISNTIEDTKDLPESISETGRIRLSHKEIMQKIGELFLLRSNITSVGSVLDSPEVFWSYPDLQPLYDAARSYLEIPQRIALLTTRVEVLQDMLQLLKNSVSSRHSEWLEQIVIALIALEIVLGIITICVDLFA